MNVDELPRHVWIAEAYQTQGGQETRVARTVHLTEDDAHADIRVLAPDREDVAIEVRKERLHTGQVESMEELPA